MYRRLCTLVKFVVDKRNHRTCTATTIAVAFAVAWALMTAAIADTLPANTGPAISQTDLVKAQWWLIGGLLGFVLVLGQGFIIYVVSSVKGDIRKLFDLHSGTLTRVAHEDIDHSGLCVVCRNVEIVVGAHDKEKG